MSVTVISRAMWTQLPDLEGKTKTGRIYRVKAHTAKSILVAMSDSADDFGENSFNSMQTLALKTSLDLRSIPRILRVLQSNGYCVYKGLSIYGTGNYTILLEKLGFPPESRAKCGRPSQKIPVTPSAKSEFSEPETSDSQRETSDSQRETSDSQRETSDSESLYPSLIIHNPSSSSSGDEKTDDEFGKFCTEFQNDICMLTPTLADMIQEAWDEFPHPWLFDAKLQAVTHKARSWAYIKKCLDNRKKVGGRPVQERKIEESPLAVRMKNWKPRKHDNPLPTPTS